MTSRTSLASPAARWMRELNARHPWSHNDHFHSWIVANLPGPGARVLDVGCGRGELLTELAPYAAQVIGNDRDTDMRQQATARSAGWANVTVTGGDWREAAGPFYAVTMIAALHHLDLEPALRDVVRLLVPGGRFLAVVLTRPRSLPDHLWRLVCVGTNPLIGYAKHPWRSAIQPGPPPFPVRDPEVTLAQLRAALRRVMPGATVRRRLGFRETIAWTKPSAAVQPG